MIGTRIACPTMGKVWKDKDSGEEYTMCVDCPGYLEVVLSGYHHLKCEPMDILIPWNSPHAEGIRELAGV